MAESKYIAGIAKKGEMHKFGIPVGVPMEGTTIRDAQQAAQNAGIAAQQATQAAAAANEAASAANELIGVAQEVVTRAEAFVVGAVKQVFLTQAEYDALVDSGTIDEDTLYNIYE